LAFGFTTFIVLIVDVHGRTCQEIIDFARSSVGQASLSRMRENRGLHLNRIAPLGAAPE
jgi:hypothetical protein